MPLENQDGQVPIEPTQGGQGSAEQPAIPPELSQFLEQPTQSGQGQAQGQQPQQEQPAPPPEWAQTFPELPPGPGSEKIWKSYQQMQSEWTRTRNENQQLQWQMQQAQQQQVTPRQTQTADTIPDQITEPEKYTNWLLQKAEERSEKRWKELQQAANQQAMQERVLTSYNQFALKYPKDQVDLVVNHIATSMKGWAPESAEQFEFVHRALFGQQNQQQQIQNAAVQTANTLINQVAKNNQTTTAIRNAPAQQQSMTEAQRAEGIIRFFDSQNRLPQSEQEQKALDWAIGTAERLGLLAE